MGGNGIEKDIPAYLYRATYCIGAVRGCNGARHPRAEKKFGGHVYGGKL